MSRPRNHSLFHHHIRREVQIMKLPITTFLSSFFLVFRLSSNYFHHPVLKHSLVVSSTPNPQAGRPPIVGCPRMLILCIRSSLIPRGCLLHPQPEDAPCRSDKGPTQHGHIRNYINNCGSGPYASL
jgi:hypothetical protein